MKNILLPLFLLVFYNCFSQNPIFPLDDYSVDEFPGAYRKDTQNDLDKFVGTWEYEDTRTNKSFMITLRKAIQIHRRSQVYDFYEDILFGDYQYKAFGIDVVNTLSNLSNINMNPYDHTILGNIFHSLHRSPLCPDCAPNERRLSLVFIDTERPYLHSRIVLRHKTLFGVEKLEATIYSEEGVLLPEENSPIEPRVPFGSYTLKKVQ